MTTTRRRVQNSLTALTILSLQCHAELGHQTYENRTCLHYTQVLWVGVPFDKIIQAANRTREALSSSHFVALGRHVVRRYLSPQPLSPSEPRGSREAQ